MIIYCARNITNDKMYVGKTKRSLEIRKQDHYEKSRKGSDTYFHRALAKYEFEWTILEHVNDECNIDDREKFWIDKLATYSTGYNMTIGGDGGYTYSKGTDLYNKIQYKLGHKGNSNPGADPEIHKRAEYTTQKNIQAGIYFKSGVSHGNNKGKMADIYSKYKGNKSSATAKAVCINGKQYSSCRAAAREFNIAAETVSRRCKNVNYIEWKFV